MKRTRLAGVLFASAALAAFAQDKPCPPGDATKAEQSIDRVSNWAQLYKAYQDYRHCDKGGNVSEGYTEALLRCIVEWKQVDGLAKPMDKDPAYKAFVIRHLNSPEAKGDLDSIYSRAKHNCPKDLDAFCSEILVTVRPVTAIEQIKVAPAPGADPKSAEPKK
jgi:hypothetical protein